MANVRVTSGDFVFMARLEQARSQVAAVQDSLAQTRLALAASQEKLRGQNISLERIRSQVSGDEDEA